MAIGVQLKCFCVALPARLQLGDQPVHSLHPDRWTLVKLPCQHGTCCSSF